MTLATVSINQSNSLLNFAHYTIVNNIDSNILLFLKEVLKIHKKIKIDGRISQKPARISHHKMQQKWKAFQQL